MTLLITKEKSIDLSSSPQFKQQAKRNRNKSRKQISATGKPTSTEQTHEIKTSTTSSHTTSIIYHQKINPTSIPRQHILSSTWIELLMYLQYLCSLTHQNWCILRRDGPRRRCEATRRIKKKFTIVIGGFDQNNRNYVVWPPTHVWYPFVH